MLRIQVVEADERARQAAAAEGRPHRDSSPPPVSGNGASDTAAGGRATGGETAPQPFTTYVASVKLDPTRVGRDAGRINEEIIQHLATLPGAEVSVTLEVHVTVPDGIDERAMRVVSENATALKLRVSTFERE